MVCDLAGVLAEGVGPGVEEGRVCIRAGQADGDMRVVVMCEEGGGTEGRVSRIDIDVYGKEIGVWESGGQEEGAGVTGEVISLDVVVRYRVGGRTLRLRRDPCLRSNS